MEGFEFGMEFQRVFDFWGTGGGRRERVAKEYHEPCRHMNEQEVKEAVEWAIGGKGLPTLTDWKDTCYGIQRERRAKEQAASDNSHIQKAMEDAQRSKSCRGGDCRQCNVRFCATITLHAAAICRDIRDEPKAGAVAKMDGQRKMLAGTFLNLGFHKPSAETCLRRPVPVDRNGRIDSKAGQ